MKLIIPTILMIVCFLLVAKTRITINPFTIRFESIYFAIGVVFVFLGISLMCYQKSIDYTKDGVIYGWNKCLNYMNDKYYMIEKK